MEERQFFPGPDGLRIEGLHARSPGAVGAVISHPHPLMGGDMGNAVVEILTDTLFAAGMSTLRFNFRGVGGSEGSFDDGRGEREDLLAALSFMEGEGVREILTAGYSFGAWVNAAVLDRRNLLPALFVSPPVDLLGFDFRPLRGKVGLIVCGERDPCCPVEKIRDIAAGLSCRLEIIPGADHFFQSRENGLAECVGDYAKRLSAAGAPPEA